VWQNRPLAPIYPILYLDAIHIKLKRSGKIDNVAVYNVLGVDLDGHREILGHWIGDGAEGANFWLSVITDLQNRGVQEVFIAAIDGLSGFKDAIQSVFPKTQVQRCVIHQTPALHHTCPAKRRGAGNAVRCKCPPELEICGLERPQSLRRRSENRLPGSHP